MSITSCRWIHETFYSVEGCTEWYLEELYEAAADDDVQDFIERWDQFQQWSEDLNRRDQEKVEEAADKWADNNEAKFHFVDNWIEKKGIDF
jgi:hypothetical protein